MLARRNQLGEHQISARPSPAADRRGDSLIEIAWRHRRTIAITTGICLLLAIAFLLVVTPQYTATAKLYVQRHAPGIIGNTAPIGGDDNGAFLFTQREILRSTPVLAIAMAEVGDLKTFSGQRNRFASLRNGLGVDIGKKDELISVSYDSKYPVDAEKIVSAVVKGYVEFQTKQKRTTAGEALQVLTQQMTKREAELDERLKALQNYRKNQGLLSADSDRTNVMLERLKSLSDELNKARVETLNAKAQHNEIAQTILKDPEKAQKVQEQVGAGGAVVATGNDEQLVRADLFRYETQLSDAKRQYGSRHPTVLLLQGRVDQLQVSYAASVERKYELAKAREADIQKLMDEQQKLALEDANKAAEYTKLQSDVQRLQKSIDVLDTQVKQVNVAEDGGIPTIQVLETARADEQPSFPSKSKTLALAMVVGLLSGFGLAVVRDRNDHPLSSARQIREALGTRVIGLVPRMTVAGRMLEIDPSSDVAEACRALYLTIFDNVPSSHCKTIMLTSPSRGDGKSTVAVNLAVAMAQQGKRVLLVDCDFRSPSVARVFDLRGRAGIGNILSAQELAEGAIHDSGVEGLDILPAGNVVGNPHDLLNSERFNAVLDHLIDVYDHVVLDAPPTVAVDDARIVAASCDVTLLVLRAGRANRRLGETAREGLAAVGANIVGIVVNDVQPHNYAQYDGVYEDGGVRRRSGKTDAATAVNGDFEVQLRSVLARRPGTPERSAEHKPVVHPVRRLNGGPLEDEE
ncbi:MAG TPA: polysaccharide biosynthesis tyrosine autokinase [Tepidisphaeraceae bacterium]|jgi:capsular exopolysaccharide synthesis family protein